MTDIICPVCGKNYRQKDYLKHVHINDFQSVEHQTDNSSKTREKTSLSFTERYSMYDEKSARPNQARIKTWLKTSIEQKEATNKKIFEYTQNKYKYSKNFTPINMKETPSKLKKAVSINIKTPKKDELNSSIKGAKRSQSMRLDDLLEIKQANSEPTRLKSISDTSDDISSEKAFNLLPGKPNYVKKIVEQKLDSLRSTPTLYRSKTSDFIETESTHFDKNRFPKRFIRGLLNDGKNYSPTLVRQTPVKLKQSPFLVVQNKNIELDNSLSVINEIDDTRSEYSSTSSRPVTSHSSKRPSARTIGDIESDAKTEVSSKAEEITKNDDLQNDRRFVYDTIKFNNSANDYEQDEEDDDMIFHKRPLSTIQENEENIHSSTMKVRNNNEKSVKFDQNVKVLLIDNNEKIKSEEKKHRFIPKHREITPREKAILFIQDNFSNKFIEAQEKQAKSAGSSTSATQNTSSGSTVEGEGTSDYIDSNTTTTIRVTSAKSIASKPDSLFNEPAQQASRRLVLKSNSNNRKKNESPENLPNKPVLRRTTSTIEIKVNKASNQVNDKDEIKFQTKDNSRRAYGGEGKMILVNSDGKHDKSDANTIGDIINLKGSKQRGCSVM